MVVTARPNLSTALIARLRQTPEIATLVSTADGWTDGRTGQARISSIMQDGWSMPCRAIRLRRTGGDNGDFSLGIYTPRVDVFCYAAKGHEAAELMELVFATFCPTQRTDAGFVAAGCVIGQIVPEADLYADVERDTGYPFAWMPFRCQFRAVA